MDEDRELEVQLQAFLTSASDGAMFGHSPSSPVSFTVVKDCTGGQEAGWFQRASLHMMVLNGNI
jgi:hypothetical protein